MKCKLCGRHDALNHVEHCMECEETAIYPLWDRCGHCKGFIGGNSVKEATEQYRLHMEANPDCDKKAFEKHRIRIERFIREFENLKPNS